MKTRAATVVFLSALTLSSVHAGAADEPTEALVKKLADFDPAVRRDAADRLVALGTSARPALRVAARSDDIQLRSQASRLLLQLPWTSESDPPAVQLLMQDYGRKDVEDRKQVVFQLVNLENDQGVAPTLRLLADEVSSAVRWDIVRLLREHKLSDKALGRLRAMTENPADLTPADAPLTAAGGWVRLRGTSKEEVARGFALLSRAIELEQAGPSDAGPNLDFAYDALIRHAESASNSVEAISLLRGRVKTTPGSRESGVLKALALLFQRHASDPSLAGLSDDIALADTYADSAEIQYALARLKQKTGPASDADDLLRRALALSNGDLEARYRVGSFLCDLNWFDLAEPELLDALKTDGPNPKLYHSNVRFRLANIAASRGDEKATADHLAAALELIGDGDGFSMTGGSLQGIRASVQWHRLRDARNRNDATDTKAALDELLKTTPDSPELLMDVMPELQLAGRGDEATAFFDRAYASVKDALAEQPDSADRMNTLAWLLARCDQRLDEALALATQATALQPDNPAYLDTLAEVQFRKGNSAEAVRLEERALSLRPGDTFMLEQLARFKQPTTRPAK